MWDVTKTREIVIDCHELIAQLTIPWDRTAGTLPAVL